MDSALDEFLKRNSVGAATGAQPLVHTTRSYKLREIISSAGLSPELCDVFEEDLLYFFVARPAYRWQKNDGSPRDWELPTCFIFDEIKGLNPVRSFPFDSGAHHRALYPSYIQQLEREQFSCSASDASRRMISAFYGSIGRYVAGEPKDSDEFIDEYSLSPLDAEVLAVNALAKDLSTSTTDDRRFSIEIQSKEKIAFSENKPSAVILPTVYLRDQSVIDALNLWGSDVLNYDTYGLSMASYFGQVFLKFTDYLKSKGVLA